MAMGKTPRATMRLDELVGRADVHEILGTPLLLRNGKAYYDANSGHTSASELFGGTVIRVALAASLPR
jgi:hypothetical protein